MRERGGAGTLRAGTSNPEGQMASSPGAFSLFGLFLNLPCRLFVRPISTETIFSRSKDMAAFLSLKMEIEGGYTCEERTGKRGEERGGGGEGVGVVWRQSRGFYF